MRRDRRKWLFLLAVAAGALAIALDAEARVGGGQHHSSGSSRSSRSSSGHSGGGGDGGAALELLIWLLVYHPRIGVPLLVVVAVVVLLHHRKGTSRTIDVRFGAEPVAARRTADPFHALKAADPAFSKVVLADFVQLVHRRAFAALSASKFSEVRPFVSDGSASELNALYGAGTTVDDIVLAGITFVTAEVKPTGQRFRARLEGSATVTRNGRSERVAFEETWTFRRAADAVSLPPDAVRRMGCPACGAAIETNAVGTCRHCDTPIGDGRLQWQLIGVERHRAHPLGPPDYAPAPGGDEPSYHTPTRTTPKLGASLRAFFGRHPDFEPAAFDQYVREVFLELQQAWSDGEWSRARPHTTDLTYDTLRFWMDRYARARLRNRLENVQVERVQVVHVDVDAWYESLTVRIWASMVDYVEDASGKVVGGNKKTTRRFSEYWTFLRTAGSGAAVRSAAQCPSCGAGLDRVDASGVCGYCDSRITSGDHGWVLSRIDQTEAYTP